MIGKIICSIACGDRVLIAPDTNLLAIRGVVSPRLLMAQSTGMAGIVREISVSSVIEYKAFLMEFQSSTGQWHCWLYEYEVIQMAAEV